MGAGGAGGCVGTGAGCVGAGGCVGIAVGTDVGVGFGVGAFVGIGVGFGIAVGRTVGVTRDACGVEATWLPFTVAFTTLAQVHMDRTRMTHALIIPHFPALPACCQISRGLLCFFGGGTAA